jgi:hypothetical protein
MITKIKTYSERLETFLSEYNFIFVIVYIIQKLCVDKKWIIPGQSIEILRYFILHYFGSHKIARISVHIRHLFIESKCLLIGCPSYISLVNGK